jgi:hypothetical protein
LYAAVMSSMTPAGSASSPLRTDYQRCQDKSCERRFIRIPLRSATRRCRSGTSRPTIDCTEPVIEGGSGTATLLGSAQCRGRRCDQLAWRQREREHSSRARPGRCGRILSCRDRRAGTARWRTFLESRSRSSAPAAGSCVGDIRSLKLLI